MKFEDKLLDLLNRMGLDRAEVERRLTFLQWSNADAQCLNQQQAARPGLERFIETFYQHLAQHPHPDGLAADDQTIKRLQHAQRAYYERLWSGPYDRD